MRGLAVLLAAFLLASCARQEPEVDFKPIQLNWIALSTAAENHPAKDACVISITSFLMRDKSVLGSKMESLDYEVGYMLQGENLEFEGKCGNPDYADDPVCRFTAVCAGAENVVVKFHNGE